MPRGTTLPEHLWLIAPSRPALQGEYFRQPSSAEQGQPVWRQRSGSGSLHRQSLSSSYWFVGTGVEEDAEGGSATLRLSCEPSGSSSCSPHELCQSWQVRHGRSWRVDSSIRLAATSPKADSSLEGDGAAAGAPASLSVAELRAQLKERGLQTTGRKAELIKRLQESASSPGSRSARRCEALLAQTPPGGPAAAPEGLETLQAMGFSKEDACAALAAVGGDVAAAAEFLADASIHAPPRKKRGRVSHAVIDEGLPPWALSLASTSTASSSRTVSSERRKEPAYRRRMPQGTDDRIERALSQRLYLLERRAQAEGGASQAEDAESAEVTFAVMGSTGNVYEVAISSVPRCNCPDFLRRQSPCKHVLFVWLRVLRLEADDPRVWQRRLGPEDVQEVLRRSCSAATCRGVCAPTRVQRRYKDLTGTGGSELEASQPGRARKALEEDDCPICCEAFEEQDEGNGLVTFCLSCGSNLHRDCIDRWQRASKKGDCPLCREPFRHPRTHVAPGEGMPAPGSSAVPVLQRHGSGSCCYLNVLGDDKG